MAKAQTGIPADRTLPHNTDAERKVVGAMIRDRDALHRAHEILGEGGFYQPANQIIYDILVDLSARNIAVDLTTLADALERKNQLAAIGGPYALAELVQAVATSANVEYHANIVRERSMRRSLIRLCSNLIETAYEGRDDAETLLAESEASIFRLAEQRGGRSFNAVGKFLDAALEKIQQAQEQQGSLTGLTSGFRDLDALTSGFQPSDLIVLAARPSVGKTSLVLNFAEQAAATGAAVGLFSLEMSSEQIAERVLCSQARVNLKHMRSGFFTKRDANQLIQTASQIHDMPLYIDDTPNLTPTEIMSRARRLKSEEPRLSMLIIDYLQLMESGRRSDGNRQQEVAEISRAMKILARDLNVPIIACSQLSRAVEKRDDHMPRLSDLRESGAIEQDADLVVFIHREPLKGEFQGEGDEDLEAGSVQHFSYKLVIAKHRNGPVGEVPIYFAKEYTRFFDAVQDQPDDEDVPF